jgi:hypothetical protein
VAVHHAGTSPEHRHRCRRGLGQHSSHEPAATWSKLYPEQRDPVPATGSGTIMCCLPRMSASTGASCATSLRERLRGRRWRRWRRWRPRDRSTPRASFHHRSSPACREVLGPTGSSTLLRAGRSGRHRWVRMCVAVRMMVAEVAVTGGAGDAGVAAARCHLAFAVQVRRPILQSWRRHWAPARGRHTSTLVRPRCTTQVDQRS